MILFSENVRQLISFKIQKNCFAWISMASQSAKPLKIPSTFDVFLVTKPIYSPCRWWNLIRDRK